MKRFTRVLCLVDLGQAGDLAFAYALALARHDGAALFIVCSIPPGEAFTSGYTERLAYLLGLRVAAEAAGIDVRIDVRRGGTARVIQQEARRRLPSVIVVSADHGADESAPAPRVAFAATLAQSAACPVLIVRGTAPVGPRPFLRVLCAVDSWRSPRTAIARSLSLLPGTGRLTLLHVASASTASPEALQRLQRLIPPDAGRPVRVAVSVGRVATEILRAAKDGHADLLVVGTYGRKGLSQHPAGIVPELLTQAECPVLVVPVPKADLREHWLPAA